MAAATAPPAQSQSADVQITQLKVARVDTRIELSVQVDFRLPTAVETALYKGVAVFFVSEAELYRKRWYWFDRKVTSVSKHLRLVYQPLTRRWRLGLVGAGGDGEAPVAALSQSFETLEEALQTVGRITGWQIATVDDLEGEAEHRLEYRFRLDVSQLPRPLQIGALGQSDWDLTAEAGHALTAQELR